MSQVFMMLMFKVSIKNLESYIGRSIDRPTCRQIDTFKNPSHLMYLFLIELLYVLAIFLKTKLEGLFFSTKNTT